MESLQVRKMINKPNPFGLGMLHQHLPIEQRTPEIGLSIADNAAI
jgi:hypothetical protein